MITDQEIAKGVETLLRQSDPNAVTSLNCIVQQLEAKLGLDLSHKAGFIRDQISLLLRAHPTTQVVTTQQLQPQQQQTLSKDHFALPHHPQFSLPPQQFSPHFALHPHHHPQLPQELNFHQPHPSPSPAPPQQTQQLRPHSNVVKPEGFSQIPAEVPKESAPVGAKRRGGPGGLNKVCGVSPELQAIVGEPALPRTEIVKQLWAYIRKNNLQDPSNKRKIICDDALRVVFETDCTDMFKMNKLLAKHIIALEPTKEASQAKRFKVDTQSTTESTESVPSPVIISEALAKFFGTGGREMLQAEASKRVWEYIKVNQLEDPLNSMVILCDANLRELLGCESISALGINEMLARKHFFRQS
ncbi:uncharacterized protein LOC116137653 [Pistacia vera]|uniref:Uncharacterized protein n=3 Tax=Pistacia TaxID=55512 RepID=A0ACC1AAQ2_9ROSI|nr:uncharacterized protein LOC116137653 [Pistacia vera]KAJ0017522.1 hypothetical protein Pint_09692 [Pistacia integerrima]KAJ0017534.1 hypothetical protein Pint_09521 [Pistacia integerrima]KAJ0083098.1 hypothetical protein Patl1_09792 [Pistacia atlantica]